MTLELIREVGFSWFGPPLLRWLSKAKQSMGEMCLNVLSDARMTLELIREDGFSWFGPPL